MPYWASLHGQLKKVESQIKKGTFGRGKARKAAHRGSKKLKEVGKKLGSKPKELEEFLSSLKNNEPQPSTSTALVPYTGGRHFPQLDVFVNIETLSDFGQLFHLAEHFSSPEENRVTELEVAKTIHAFSEASKDLGQIRSVVKRGRELISGGAATKIRVAKFRKTGELVDPRGPGPLLGPLEDALEQLPTEVIVSPAESNIDELIELELNEEMEVINNQPTGGEGSDTAVAAAPSGGGGGGGGGDAGLGSNRAGDFHQKRKPNISFRHVGNNYYIAQRVRKVKVKASEVESRLLWSKRTTKDTRIDDLFSVGDNTVPQRFAYHDLQGAVALGNLNVGNYLDGPARYNIACTDGNWTLVAYRGHLTRLNAWELIPQYSEGSVVNKIKAPVQQGLLLGHVYYGQGAGDAIVRPTYPDNREFLDPSTIGLGERNFQDNTNNFITSGGTEENEDWGAVRLQLDRWGLRRRNYYKIESGSGDTTISSTACIPNVTEGGSHLDDYGVSLDKLIKQRVEIQAGMDGRDIWACKGNRVVDKRFQSSAHRDYNMTHAHPEAGHRKTPLDSFDHCATSGYRKLVHSTYIAAGNDPNNLKTKTLINRRVDNQKAMIFFMPFAHYVDNNILDIEITFDITYSCIFKRDYQNVIVDYLLPTFYAADYTNTIDADDGIPSYVQEEELASINVDGVVRGSGQPIERVAAKAAVDQTNVLSGGVKATTVTDPVALKMKKRKKPKTDE